MNKQQRRVKDLELSLTPLQAVLLWLKRAQTAAGYMDGGLESPPPREILAKSVSRATRNSMKGHPEPAVEQAIQQARQQADLLYQLVVQANSSILGDAYETRKSLMLVSGHLQATICVPEDRIKESGLIPRLRLSLTLVLENFLITEEACSRISSERLEGQDVLFPDTRRELSEQIQVMKMLSDCFNEGATDFGEDGIDWEQIRTSIQPDVDQQVANWVDLARTDMLLAYGKPDSWREPAQRLRARRMPLDSILAGLSDQSPVREEKRGATS
jgi:hypothetical protein